MTNIERIFWAVCGGIVLTSGLYLIREAAQAANDWHQCAQAAKAKP